MKYKLKKLFRLFGFDIIGYSPVLSQTSQIVTSLKINNIDAILDIGANKGQFAVEILEGGFDGEIISFEPQKEMHELCKVLSSKYYKWKVHDQCAIGNSEGEITINISKNSVSSSILKINETHINSAPNSSFISSELVKITTIDKIFPNYFNNTKKYALKIDTQGFEWQVLQGASQTLNNISGIIIEMSIFPLYEEQILWQQIHDFLIQNNFSLWAVQPGLIDRTTGKTLQMDCIYFK